MANQEYTSLRASLERLLIANQIRELVGHERPITSNDLSFALKSAFRFFKHLGNLAVAKSRFSRIILDSLAILILRLIMHRWRIIRHAPAVITAIHERAYNNYRKRNLLFTDVMGYITSTDKETPLIRNSIIADAMGRHGICVELLIRRFESTQPDTESRHWLSFFLKEFGDTAAANAIAPSNGLQDGAEVARHTLTREQPSSSNANPRLKYGIVVSAMFNSEVFRASLKSLMASDFQGEIVVAEDGNNTESVCESFCLEHGIKYSKNPHWTGLAETLNRGIQKFDENTDVIVWSHSDVLWPPYWFSQLDDAWEKVFALDKVMVINLANMDLVRNRKPTFNELFVHNNYEDLIWIIKSMKDIRELAERVIAVEIKDTGRTFGLAGDVVVDRPSQLRMMSSHNSPAGNSFLMETWRDMRGFDEENGVLPAWSLAYHAITNRKWVLWTNNTPIIHLGSSDTAVLTGTDRQIFLEHSQKHLSGFLEKTGWDLHHFMWTFFAESCVIYHDEIVNAANELSFSDIDFIFDDFANRLKTKKLSNCEIVWCPSIANCQYV